MQRSQQERVEIGILDGDFSLYWKWVCEPQGVTARDFSRAHRGTQGQPGRFSVGNQIGVKTADHFLPHTQIRDAECAICNGRLDWPLSLQPKIHLTAQGNRRLQLVETFEWERRAD